MRLIVPTYIETIKRHGSRDAIYRCRPLLFAGPQTEHRELGRATGKLKEELKKELSAAAAGGAERILADYHYDTPVTTSTQKLRLDLRSAAPEAKYLFVQLPMPDGRVSFSPSLPDLWFEVLRGDSLNDRATQVYSQYFRRSMRREGSTPDLLGLQGKAWVTSLEVDVTPARDKKNDNDNFAALFSNQPVDGEDELRRVGRSLRQRDAEDLTRCVHRDREVIEVARMLTASDRRPIALVGPAMVGKSSILHEVVRRWMEQEARGLEEVYADAPKQKKKKKKRGKPDIWLISPQRLQSGMQYVGQWEDRVLAILKFAQKKNQVLWFDDLPGLYLAGVTRDSKLSMADVIREHMSESPRARLVFELTAEQLAHVRETDRRLADQLHFVSIEETDDRQTMQILIAAAARLEAKHECQFTPTVIPLAADLTRRHQRTSAQPGKSASLLNELAVRHSSTEITRPDVLKQFHRKTGVSLDLLDDARTLDRDTLLQSLNNVVVGQTDATEAVADVAFRAKSNLADPKRPLATMLFLGPTGVGKTHCARAMADLLFGGREGLTRLDMNEFVSPRAASRLIGTPYEPEGLLTGPILRRPHSVVLLDEIEKAHPDVFDLLLQVLGEGRLTDQRGRTADFTQCVLIMTSNLGTQESSRRIQLGNEADNRTPIKAAERFFRPEMFNRIDRVLSFQRLGQPQIRRIVDSLLSEVFSRDGFARRRCLMDVHPHVRDSLAVAGFDPQYGARALRRAIERKLCGPISERLSEIKLDTPAMIRLLPAQEGMSADVVPLLECDPTNEEPQTTEDLVAATHRLIERAEPQIADMKPAGGYVVGADNSTQLNYYALSDLMYQLRQQLEQLEASPEMNGQHDPDNSLPHNQSRRTKNMIWHSHRNVASRRLLKEIASAEDINAYLDELNTSDTEAAGLASDVAGNAALLQWLTDDRDSSDNGTSGVLWYRTFEGNAQHDNVLRVFGRDPTSMIKTGILSGHKLLFGNTLGLEVTRLGNRDDSHLGLAISGASAQRLASRECGMHMIVGPGSMSGVRVDWIPTRKAITKWDDFQEYGPQQWADWIDKLQRGEATIDDEPAKPGSVIRVYQFPELDTLAISKLRVHDLRSGTTSQLDVRRFFFAGLPRVK